MNAELMFPQWEQEQPACGPDYPDRLRDMWTVYGKAGKGVVCGTCVHCIKVNHNAKLYYKCDLSTITRGAGSDWRLKWPGCGKHEVRGQ